MSANTMRSSSLKTSSDASLGFFQQPILGLAHCHHSEPSELELELKADSEESLLRETLDLLQLSQMGAECAAGQ